MSHYIYIYCDSNLQVSLAARGSGSHCGGRGLAIGSATRAWGPRDIVKGLEADIFGGTDYQSQVAQDLIYEGILCRAKGPTEGGKEAAKPVSYW